MNLEELWIGDTVRLKSSGKIGIYIGQNVMGKARVKCGDKVILSKSSNLEQYTVTSKEQPKFDLIVDESQPILSSVEIPREIDLHIEILNPSLVHEAPQIILNYQIKKYREYMEQVIQVKHEMVSIIHGKGTGQLKKEVTHLVSLYDEFNYAVSSDHGGATEIWLKYD